MRDDLALVNLLCCPTCRGGLRIHDTTVVSSDGHVMVGKLECLGCSAIYPILGGVPRFVPDSLTADVSQTIRGFGYEWRHASPIIQNTQFTTTKTFLNFVHPVQPDYFRGKIVLDAGCGSGRFTHWAQQFGAAAVVGVDLSESVEVAFENMRSFPNVLIIQADLLALPLRQGFDYIFSVGVLHHTSDPRRAFDAVVALAKPGGGVSAWVYGRENNEWIIYFLDPIRRNLTSRLPRDLLLAMSYAITVPMFLILKGIYKPVGEFRWLTWLRGFLFYFDYLYFLSGFGFHEQVYIVFDHLSPAIAEYIPRDEFARWFDENGLRDVVITSRAGNSWRGFGVRPSSEGQAP